MSSPLERRYRRVVRLLPANYRAHWEEDMVAAFLDAAEPSDTGQMVSHRSMWAERLSVMALAVRLRLNGSHATSRALVWYHVVHRIALMVLLYQAVAATTSIEVGVGLVMRYTGQDPPVYESIYMWSRLFDLLWVAAFGCFALGRFVVARVLVLLASAIGVAVTIVSINGFNPASYAIYQGSLWAWLAISVAAVFVTPPDAHASGRLWLGAYLVGSLLTGLVAARAFVPLIAGYWRRLPFGDLTHLASVALIIAMVVALLKAWPDRHRSPRWLLALAIVAGGIGAKRLMMSFAMDASALGGPTYASVWLVLAATLVCLAVACAAAGLLRLRQLPAVDVRS